MIETGIPLTDNEMAEIGLMASHGYPTGLGRLPFHPQQGFSRVLKDSNYFLHYQCSNVDVASSHAFNFGLLRKEECRSIGGLLECQLITTASSSRCPVLLDLQGTHHDSLPFGFEIAKHSVRQEKILELLTSESIEDEGGLPDLLHDLGPQHPTMDLPLQPLDSCSSWFLADAGFSQSLLSLTSELYISEPGLVLEGERRNRMENIYHSRGQLLCNCNETYIYDIPSAISELQLAKDKMNSSKQAMLVPFFERRRRGRSNADSSKVKIENTENVKSQGKIKDKASPKKKMSARSAKERKSYSNSHIHAYESLLSVIVDRKQLGTNAILSLKKSGTRLPQLLTQFSGSIAGTGITVVLSVVFGVICKRVPFCWTKLWSTGLGLGLVWLSWGVNKLRDTLISIGKSSGKFDGEEEKMMDQLDRNLNDICFRAAALMAVAVLRLA